MIDKLETAVGSVAEAWVLEWSNATSDWQQTGEIISVHNFNGRHFGLPHEKGWAKCEGDSKKPEVVSLEGLIRFGKLAAALSQGSSASMQIWNTPTGFVNPNDSGYTINVYDFVLPSGAKLSSGAEIWAQFDCISERWYLLSWVKGPLLGKPASDIANNASGTVNVYAGTPQGSEATDGTVTAYNRMHGKARAGEWCWMDSQDGGVSWEIVEAVGSDLIYGKTTASSTLSATFPGNNATVNIYKNGTNTGVSIQAAVVHAPIIDGEGVHCVWTGEQFSIVAGDFDGGILATYTGTGTASILGVGSSSSSFKVAPGPGADPTTQISFSVSNNEAPVLKGTKLWLGRNANRFYVVSGQMSSAYGKVDQTSLSSTDITPIGSMATVHVYQSGSDTMATITALVEHAPIFGGEFVSCEWDGLQWIIVSGDYDGGINGQYGGGSDLAKGGSSSSFTVQIYPESSPMTIGGANFSVSSPLGSVGAGKLVRISRDANGLFVTAAEC